MPDVKGLSERNIRYALAFYELYGYLPQVVADNIEEHPSDAAKSIKSKLGENPSGLKLTYKAKDGSFKVYTDIGGKAKTTTVNVTGVMVNDVGCGTATIKGKGSVTVMVE